MKILVLIILVILGTLLSGIYGGLQDQIAYTVSPEFFTKLRFPNMHIDSSFPPRLGAAIVGFKSTWNVGFILGGILSMAGYIHSKPSNMFKFTIHSFFIALIFAFVFSLIGLGIGGSDNEVTANSVIVDLNHFYAVERMINFSKIGGVAGMFIGIFYQLYKKKKLENITYPEKI
jgi:MFS family permease